MRPWILAKNICQTTIQKTQDLWTKPRVGTRFHEITKTSWLVVTGTMEFYDFPIRLGSSSSQLTFTNHHFSEGQEKTTNQQDDHCQNDFLGDPTGKDLHLGSGGVSSCGWCATQDMTVINRVAKSDDLMNFFFELRQQENGANASTPLNLQNLISSNQSIGSFNIDGRIQ